MKTFGGGKHLGGGRYLGEERFNWTARLPRRPRRPEGENIWGRKNLIGQPASLGGLGGRRGKTFGGGKIWLDPEGEIIWGRKKFGGGKHLGEERFNWMKTFGGGKHLGEEDIWVRKDLIG